MSQQVFVGFFHENFLQNKPKFAPFRVGENKFRFILKNINRLLINSNSLRKKIDFLTYLILQKNDAGKLLRNFDVNF